MLAFCSIPTESQEDNEKFRLLYETYASTMFFTAKQILKDDGMAEDAVQESFLKIIPHLYKIDDVFCHKTKAFLVVVSGNVAKRMYMERKKEAIPAGIDDEDEFPLPDNASLLPEAEVIDRMSVKVIVEKIKLLPEIYRDVLVLRFVHGLSDKEVASMLKLTGPTVRKRVERGRLKLIELLKEEDSEHANDPDFQKPQSAAAR